MKKSILSVVIISCCTLITSTTLAQTSQQGAQPQSQAGAYEGSSCSMLSAKCEQLKKLNGNALSSSVECLEGYQEICVNIYDVKRKECEQLYDSCILAHSFWLRISERLDRFVLWRKTVGSS